MFGYLLRHFGSFTLHQFQERLQFSRDFVFCGWYDIWRCCCFDKHQKAAFSCPKEQQRRYRSLFGVTLCTSYGMVTREKIKHMNVSEHKIIGSLSSVYMPPSDELCLVSIAVIALKLAGNASFV